MSHGVVMWVGVLVGAGMWLPPLVCILFRYMQPGLQPEVSTLAADDQLHF